MRNVKVHWAGAVALLAAGLLAADAAGQAPRVVPEPGFWGRAPRPAPDVVYPVVTKEVLPPGAARPPAGVGQIEIYDGPRRTVQFVAPTLSPGEQAALRDLARAENEASYASDVLALKRRYVDDELLLAPYRRSVQQVLYGYNKDATFGDVGGFGWGGYGGYYPYAFANPYAGGWGGGFGSYFAGGTTSVSHTLATGMGYEGPLKDAMARQIAAEATPDFGAGAARGVDAAWGRVGASDRLARDFGITRGGVAPAAAGANRIVLTLKNGDKVDGTLYGEDAEWFKVETATGTVSVRKADVSRVEVPKK